jgi:hypothetical protein
VGDKGAALIVVLFCFCLLMSAPGIVFASSGNWVEVITFTSPDYLGSSSHFTVDYVDWRIRWEINPSNSSEGPSFTVHVLPDSRSKEISYLTTHETTGILNIYNHSGSFYLFVSIRNVDNCKLIIEQNIESIPEFPSWIILPLFVTTTLAVIICRNILRRKVRSS